MSAGEEAAREVRRAAADGSDGTLHLSGLRLRQLPALDQHQCCRITRLDLSSNRIEVLSPSVRLLSGLRELWLAHNPLRGLPDELGECRALELLDVSHTLVQTLPVSLGRLRVLDWRDTPLAAREGADQGAYTLGLRGAHARGRLRGELETTLKVGHFAQDLLRPRLDEEVAALVGRVSEELPDPRDFAMFCRQAARLLPARLRDVSADTPGEVRRKLAALQTEAAKQRLSADVDMRVRCVYYDRVERSRCAEIVRGVCAAAPSLEDLRFFVAHAARLLPSDPALAEGALVWANALALQSQLCAQRAGAVASIAAAIGAVFPEQEPCAVRALAEGVCAALQRGRFPSKGELARAAFLAAEARELLPPHVDFAAVSARAVAERATQLFKART